MSLLVTIEKIQALLVVISSMKKGLGKEILQHLAFDDEVQKMYEQLSTSLADEPPLSLQEGGIFQDGFHKELDQLRELITGGKQWITEFQAKEQESTGIPNLKVQFNKVFGYYIEVTKSHTSKVPDHYERKQTLVNAERYTIPELKEYEHKVLTAEEKAFQLEYELFCELRRDILSKLSVLQKRAQGLAMLDVITTYAQVAHRGSYTRPEMSDKFSMSIENGRHPVVERMLTSEDESFVPNDVQFSEKGVHCAVITGPNMAGKSTYLRQNALILYMAQCGMFVPATAATLSVVDRIFTRVGAHDNLSKGQSTFMVEMQEAAFILRNATKNSFIILDEVGRGTSTYDGLSLAWAIFHYIHENIGAKTLFATHYHELISMIEALAHAKNYAVAVSDTKEGVLFLRKIIEGGISKSYGIEVAKRAGVPEDVLLHAEKTLLSLEKAPSNRGNGPEQLSFFAPVEIIEKEVIKSDPIIDKLKALHPESMSPLDALQWIIDHKPTD